MKIRKGQEDNWQSYIDSGDPYAVNYARNLATAIEEAMERGEALETAAQRDQFEVEPHRITGPMYVSAMSILSRVWEHGEELGRWYSQYTKTDEPKGLSASAAAKIANDMRLVADDEDWPEMDTRQIVRDFADRIEGSQDGQN